MTNEIYLVNIETNDDTTMTLGVSTSIENAEKMIDIINHTDGFEYCTCEYFPVKMDTIYVNDKEILIDAALDPKEYYTLEEDLDFE